MSREGRRHRRPANARRIRAVDVALGAPVLGQQDLAAVEALRPEEAAEAFQSLQTEAVALRGMLDEGKAKKVEAEQRAQEDDDEEALEKELISNAKQSAAAEAAAHKALVGKYYRRYLRREAADQRQRMHEMESFTPRRQPSGHLHSASPATVELPRHRQPKKQLAVPLEDRKEKPERGGTEDHPSVPKGRTVKSSKHPKAVHHRDTTKTPRGPVVQQVTDEVLDEVVSEPQQQAQEPSAAFSDMPPIPDLHAPKQRRAPPIPNVHASKQRRAATSPSIEIVKEDPMMTYATWGIAGVAGVGVVALIAYCACKQDSGPPKRPYRR